MPPIFPIILCGGSGTRLWPLSRAMYPKQFIRFFSDKGATLLGETLKRLGPDDGFAPPIILCNNDHRFLVKEETARAGIEPRAIILEPIARNTAPAIAVAALAACRDDENAILAVMPSDQVVKYGARFVAAVRRAAEIAATGKLVLFGIVPSEPHTGYGYIRKGAPLEGMPGAFAVDAFFEKPDLATAQSYLAQGGYFWNSGIFVLHARTFLDELGCLEPRILDAAQGALDHAATDLEFLRLERTAFASAPSISVDYAVMEKTKAAVMLPIDVGWNDVGSWSSLWGIAPQDEAGNAVHGDAMLEDTSGCYVHSAKSLVATVGIRDLVIVNTPDALLVADKSRSQEVSKLVARIKQSNRHEHERPPRSYYPWGFYETLSLGPRFQVKLAHVKPGGSLSLQAQDQSSQHWIVMQGTAKVAIEGVEKLVTEGESVRIDAIRPHRLENPGKVPLELIEVQIGAHLGEDDIIRSDVVSHRAPGETR